MSYYVTSSDTLTDLADAIRTKGGTSEPLEFPDEFISAIGDISTELPTQTKSATPTESAQTITPDTGYTLSSVSVGAIDSNYVGSGIDRNDSTDLTASGATVTAPAGYYSAAASKSVASGSATTPATSITANPSISVSSGGLITASVSGSKSVTPAVTAGYVSSGTAGTVSVSGSNTEQLSTQTGKTVTPTESEQTAVASGKYTTGAVKVAAIPSDYVGSGIDQRSSSDLTASGATVTAPAGYYGSSASASVASGSAGTPTATKGTVSNHTISVTPSVTNTTGYITGGTKTGTAVTVQASELVSGTKSITSNGTGIDVANYSAVDVGVYPTYKLTISGISYCTVTYKGTTYNSQNSYFNFTPGETCTIYTHGGYSYTSIYVNGVKVAGGLDVSSCTYEYTLPSYNVQVVCRQFHSYDTVETNVDPATIHITSNGEYDVTDYYVADVDVPTGTARSSSDLTVSGATVTVPAGLYSSEASASVASGSAGTPTASKGTVSNHSVSVTPSVTNTTGYISGGTKTGTAVTVQASELVSGTKSITTNGTGIDVANYSKVDVAVSGDVPVYQSKTNIDPTESSQTITPDTGYDALSSVQINAIDSDYVGSGIDRRDDTDLTASGATVTVPAGYYADTETKSIASGSATTPATSITANPSISVNSSTGLITATASASKSVTPTVSAGYVSSGTSGTVSVSGSNTSQLSVQAATTFHPSTTDQTISSGKYTTGTQTIKGVVATNLLAENIVEGVTIKIGDSTDDDCVASVTGTASSGGGMVVVETTDEHGGTIVEITGEEIKLQAKTNISPTTSSQTIEPDNGYTGLSSVQINAMPSGSATAPNSISGTSATVSTGTNTLTLTKTVSVTPSVTAGYVASGTAGNSSVSLTASVTTKAAATITPTKSTQTISSGTYLTGTQTIAAIPAAYQDVTGVTAAAGDVVSGKDIVNSSGTVVHGSLVIQHYYTGSGTPSSSTGVNGDIYLKTS